MLGEELKSPLESQEASILRTFLWTALMTLKVVFIPQILPGFHSNWQFPSPSLKTVQGYPLFCGNTGEWGHHFLRRTENCSGTTHSWKFTPARTQVTPTYQRHHVSVSRWRVEWGCYCSIWVWILRGSDTTRKEISQISCHWGRDFHSTHT